MLRLHVLSKSRAGRRSSALLGLACSLVLLAGRHAVGEALDEGPEVLTRVRVVGGDRDADEIARGGFPLPRDLEITDLHTLSLARERATDDGGIALEAVPVQLRALSRWGGRRDDVSLPLRWVLADAQARPGEELVLIRRRPQPSDLPPIARVAIDGVVVDDGRLELRIPNDRFAPLIEARLRADDYQRSRSAALTDAGLDVEVVVRDPSGGEHVVRLSDAPEIVTRVEESGPLRATVRSSGELSTSAGSAWQPGLRATLRFGFARRSAAVSVSLELRNDTGAPVDALAVRIRVPTRIAGDVTFESADGTVTGRTASVEQRYAPLDDASEEDSFAYTWRVDGVTRARGKRSDGSLSIRSGGDALGVAAERFWQRAPSAVSFVDGVLTCDVLPRREVAHTLPPGRALTSRAHLSLDGRRASSVRRLVVAADWVTRCGVSDPLGIPGADIGDGVRNVAARHLERLQRGLIDVTVCDPQGPLGRVPPASIVTQRETRGGANPALPYDVDLYGWRRFGDLVDARGPSGGRHGWVVGLCRAYLARADTRFLEAALDLARLRVETADVVSGTRSVEGLLLLHDLTGDAEFLATARRLVEGSSEEASELRAVLAFDAHESSPDTARRAERLLDELLATEEQRHRSTTLPELVDTLLDLRAYHRSMGDPRSLAALLRGLRVLESRGYAGTGRSVNGAYLPLQIHAGEQAVPLHTPLGLCVADCLAYAYRVTGEDQYLERAREIFRDAVLFLQAPALELVAPGYHAAVSAAPLRYPGREIAFGELVLHGAPWLMQVDARRVMRGLPVTATQGELLQVTADAVASSGADSTAPPREPVVGAAHDAVSEEVRLPEQSRGEHAVRAEPAVPAEPVTETPTADSSAGADAAPSADAERTHRVVTLDDADAVFAGRWAVEHRQDALNGAFSVAGAAVTPASATFRVLVPVSGRVRVYGLFRRSRRPAARAAVTLEGADGVLEVQLDTAHGAGRWRLLGELRAEHGERVRVRIEHASSTGVLGLDGVRLEPVR